MRQPRATPCVRPAASAPAVAGEAPVLDRLRARAPHDVERLRPQAVARERDGVALGPLRRVAAPAHAARPRAHEPRAGRARHEQLEEQIRREEDEARAAVTTEDAYRRPFWRLSVRKRAAVRASASTASAAAAASCAPRRRPGTRGTRPRAGGGARPGTRPRKHAVRTPDGARRTRRRGPSPRARAERRAAVPAPRRVGGRPRPMAGGAKAFEKVDTRRAAPPQASAGRSGRR